MVINARRGQDVEILVQAKRDGTNGGSLMEVEIADYKPRCAVLIQSTINSVGPILLCLFLSYAPVEVASVAYVSR